MEPWEDELLWDDDFSDEEEDAEEQIEETGLEIDADGFADWEDSSDGAPEDETLEEALTMTALPFILPVVCPTVREYRNETCPAFPPHDAIPSLQIFSADWAIWSGRAVVLRRSRNPIMPPITTVLSWSLNSTRMLPHSK